MEENSLSVDYTPPKKSLQSTSTLFKFIPNFVDLTNLQNPSEFHVNSANISASSSYSGTNIADDSYDTSTYVGNDSTSNTETETLRELLRQMSEHNETLKRLVKELDEAKVQINHKYLKKCKQVQDLTTKLETANNTIANLSNVLSATNPIPTQTFPTASQSQFTSSAINTSAFNQLTEEERLQLWQIQQSQNVTSKRKRSTASDEEVHDLIKNRFKSMQSNRNPSNNLAQTTTVPRTLADSNQTENNQFSNLPRSITNNGLTLFEFRCKASPPSNNRQGAFSNSNKF